MGYGTYSGQPPIPEKVVDPAGRTVFTGEDVREGQKVFLRNGLMEYGSAEDQILTRTETDHELRLVRYRARSQICNHCPVKNDCTDSEHGREIVRAMDPWPHSEAGRFHRGISLVVALISGLILVAETLRNHAPLELAVLGATLVVVALTPWHLHAAFRTTPANFPVFQAEPSSPVPGEGRPTGYRKSKEARR
jgi:hypothetical protein